MFMFMFMFMTMTMIIITDAAATFDVDAIQPLFLFSWRIVVDDDDCLVVVAAADDVDGNYFGRNRILHNNDVDI